MQDNITPAVFLVTSGSARTCIGNSYFFAHKSAPMQYQAKSPNAPKASRSGFTLISSSRNCFVPDVVDAL